MIKAQDVTQDIYSKVEGSIWRNVQRIKGYDWYQTGYSISVAPTEHQLIEYGREWALARYFQDGGRWQDAVEEATKAMYRYAYDDIKSYIKYTARETRRIDVREMAYDWSELPSLDQNLNLAGLGTTYTTTARTPLYYQQPEYDYQEFTNMVDSLDLSKRGKQIVLLYAHGFKPKEITEYLGVSRETFRRYRDVAFDYLRSYYG